jgi:hypothetical protein
MTGNECELVKILGKSDTYVHLEAPLFEQRLNAYRCERSPGSAGSRSRLEPWESSEQEQLYSCW